MESYQFAVMIGRRQLLHRDGKGVNGCWVSAITEDQYTAASRSSYIHWFTPGPIILANIQIVFIGEEQCNGIASLHCLVSFSIYWSPDAHPTAAAYAVAIAIRVALATFGVIREIEGIVPSILMQAISVELPWPCPLPS